jgi:hypothetical protein
LAPLPCGGHGKYYNGSAEQHVGPFKIGEIAMANGVSNSKGKAPGERPAGAATGRAGPVLRRRISPWVLVVLVVLLFCLAFAVMTGIALVIGPVSHPVARGLQERTMPDGTILVLEKVTVGTTHHFEWQRKQSFADWVGGNWSGKQTANASAPGEAIVVWFSRRDAATGACLDVDWWLRSAAVNDGGEEIDDDNAGRDSFFPHGGSGLSGSRPFSAEAPGKYDSIVAHSSLRPFRHSGDSFKLRVYNVRDEVVAEFDVPHSVATTLPVWTAEPLPVTKKAGDLDVTVMDLAVELDEYRDGSRMRTRYTVKPVLRVLRDGQVEGSRSSHEIEFEDAFGNSGDQWDCRLSFSEPAWKLKIKFWPGEAAPAEPTNEWSLPRIALPEANHAELLRQTKTLEGMTIELVAAGGEGEVVYADSSPAGLGNSSRSVGSVAESAFEVTSRADRGVKTTTIKCKSPHLLLRPTGADPDHRLVIRVRDDQGRDVPIQQAYAADQMVVFLQLKPEAKALDVTLVVQQPRKVEFFVKPPQIDRTSEVDATHVK